MSTNKLGRIIATEAVIERMKTDYAFNHFIDASLERFKDGDWGHYCGERKMSVEDAVRFRKRIHAIYHFNEDPNDAIRIIPEWDQNKTMILFDHEY